MFDTRWLALVIALTLGGCNSEWMHVREQNERANTVYPPNYKAEIVAFMRTYLNDPRQIREAFVSTPALRSIEGRSRYSVCLRYNPKNADGRYGGSRDNLVLFRDGRFDRLIDSRIDVGAGPDPAREQCKDAPYQRFPELEALTR